MGGGALAERGDLVEVPLAGVEGDQVLPFPIYIKPHPDRAPVLFAEDGTRLGRARLARLHSSGLNTFFVPPDRVGDYYAYLEEGLEAALQDESIPLEDRCRRLQAVVVHAAGSLLKARPDKVRLERMLRILDAVTGLAGREAGALRVLRRMVEGDPSLAGHSVGVSFYALGIGLHLFRRDLERAGLLAKAAFLHDVGRAPAESEGGEGLPPGTVLDPEAEGPPDYSHTRIGAELLQEFGLPEEVVRTAAEHHEREDGSGAPLGLSGGEIHPFAKATALADVFDHIRSSHRGFLGIYETFRILIQSFPGCFDPAMVEAFLHTFGPEGGGAP